MLKTSTIVALILTLSFSNSFTQSIRFQDTTKLLFEFNIIDYPYLKSSYTLYKYNMYFSPSMFQALQTTTSLYNLSFWALSKLKYNKIKNPYKLTAYKLASTYLVLIGLIYLPGGDSWLHEEFHRSILTMHNISSFDQVYKLPLFASVISVNRVSDKDLIELKSNYPIDFIRLSEAGIEGEYLLVENLQKRSFYLHQNYLYNIPELAITLNSIYYVFMCHTDKAINLINQFNSEETSISQRDFIGLDFTAWVYDLFRPYEPYTQRGIHPTGLGINRYIKPNDLTPEEYNFLKLQGYLQFLNLFSPFLLNKNSLNYNNLKFNFAIRHYLTSFGYYIKLQLFTDYTTKLIYSINLYKNYFKFYPAFEIELFNYQLSKNNLISFKSLFGLQPYNLEFKTKSAMPIGYFSLSYKHFFRNLGIYIFLSFKNTSWIPGEIYQTPSASLRFGFVFK